MKNNQQISIKGIREGLLINAEIGTWEEQKTEIFRLVNEKESFFKGARACLDVGETYLRVKEITSLRNKLSEHGVTLWAILSRSEHTNNNARTLGLETSLPMAKENKSIESSNHDSGEKAVLVHKTLRAGYRVESKDHVVIIGDVNPGAEIISSGNIIVWGKLKGSAVAGCDGNLKSVICALELRPTNLRIGELAFPPIQKKGKASPETALIKNDLCKIELWNIEKER